MLTIAWARIIIARARIIIAWARIIIAWPRIIIAWVRIIIAWARINHFYIYFIPGHSWPLWDTVFAPYAVWVIKF